MSLFGASSSRASNKHLVEFRAGKMSLKGTTVTPDKRKGLVYVQQMDDSLIHFCWKDRTSGKVEDDLIIFPDDCEFKRVNQCTTGRVYILKFKLSSRKFFFWMQEPKTEKDDEYCKKVNDALNNPPAPGQQSGGSEMTGLDQLGQGNLQDLFANMDQQQLLQLMTAGGGLGGNLGGLGNLISGAGRSGNRSSRGQASASSRAARAATTTTTPSVTATPSATERASVTPAPAVVMPTPATATPSDRSNMPNLQLSQLQNILSQMGMQADGTVAPEAEPVDLSKAITPEVMIPILANSQVQERLKPFLPQGETIPSTADELRATVQSAQFRQAMSSFSEALATGQLGPVLKQFGLPESAQNAAAKGDVEGFAKAMQENESKEKDVKEEDMVVE